jgi:hypothetical protein
VKRAIIVTFILILTGILFAHTVSSTYRQSVSEISVIKGKINIQDDHRSSELERLSLDGEWEFYWNQWLSSDEIRRNNIQPDYIQVPSSWRGKSLNGKPLMKYGYATYRILIQIPMEDIGEDKALFLRNVGSAYQIWIDDQLKEGIGETGQSLSQEKPMLQMNLVLFEPKKEIVEVILQVSNHSFREGGIIGEVSYGDTKALIPYVLKGLLQDVFIAGGFFNAQMKPLLEKHVI